VDNVDNIAPPHEHHEE